MKRTRRISGRWLVAALVAIVAGAKAQANDIKATFGDEGLAVQSSSDAFKFDLGGRFHTDYGLGASPAIRGEFPKPAALRRVWIEPTLTLNKNLIFDLQYDLASTSMPINNLLVSYKSMGLATVTAGNMKEPFSLEQLMSNNDTTFLERSLADTFAPSRNTGAAVGFHGDRWTLSGGIFGGNINTSVGNGGTAATARATYAPLIKDDVLHFGIATSYRSFGRDASGVSFGNSPESFLFKTALVDTDTIEGVKSVKRGGLEFAWTHGPLRMQSELIVTQVERERANDLSFQGGYINLSWVFNGEAAKYTLDAKTATEIGVFKRVEPSTSQRVSHGGLGVFEAAARYSAIDLTSRDIRGGTQQDITLGLNWYPEPFLRVLANYIHAWADPTSVILTGRPARADIGQVRIQVAF